MRESQADAMLPAALPAQWRAEARILRRNGDEVGARIKERDADDLEAAFLALGDLEVDRETAAALLDTAPDSLSRKTREGKVRNRGRRLAPRYRLRELLSVDAIPGLPPFAEEVEMTGATRTQIARSIVAAGGDDGQ